MGTGMVRFAQHDNSGFGRETSLSGAAAGRVEITGDVVDIGRAKATRQIIARGGRIEKVSAVGNVVKRRKRLLHVEEAVECRVGEAYTGLTVRSQILVDACHATCPDRGGCARP